MNTMCKLRKILGIMVLAVVIINFGFRPQTVDAQTLTFTTAKPKECNFAGCAWERTRNIYYIYTDIVVGELCYGFDTFLTNEDYVWTRSIQYDHKSYLVNNSGSYVSATYPASADATWAKVEKANSKSSNPTYGIKFLNVYDLDKSDFTVDNGSPSSHK